MRMPLILLPLAALALAGCARDGAGHAYAGSPGSTYDAARNPAQANGLTTYDPTAPITPRDFGNSGGAAPAPAR